jgi:hypothetical protein
MNSPFALRHDFLAGASKRAREARALPGVPVANIL